MVPEAVTGVVGWATVYGVRARGYDRSFEWSQSPWHKSHRSFKFYIYIFSRCLNTLTFFAQAQAHSFSGRKRKSESISARAAKAPRCLITIKRNDNFITANTLPKVLMVNPRSLYNKVNEFKTFLKEQDIDLALISEIWERQNQPLDSIIKIDNFKFVSYPHQRSSSTSGVRPAIFVNTSKFNVDSINQCGHTMGRGGYLVCYFS